MCHRFDEAKLRLANRDEIALLQLLAIHAHGVDEHAVAAAEIFDERARRRSTDRRACSRLTKCVMYLQSHCGPRPTVTVFFVSANRFGASPVRQIKAGAVTLSAAACDTCGATGSGSSFGDAESQIAGAALLDRRRRVA